ncbi:MAG: beta-N-acetylglucosaminidase domain-containing protein [Actinomycetaceae bacterium]|nr:beta-N-acetylglucosaminidase domain-containing protein [Actinomycetaceae bacterium]
MRFFKHALRYCAAGIAAALVVAIPGPAMAADLGNSALTEPIPADATPLPAAPAENPDLPKVSPVPQSMKAQGESVDVSGKVRLEVDKPDQNANAAARARGIIEGVGGTVLEANAQGATARIVLTTDPAVAARASGLTIKAPRPAEGYALRTTKSRVPTVVILGTDADGLFYGVRTLEQLEWEGKIPGVTVDDWPNMRVRGVVEGFYGQPWSRQARLDLMETLGDAKLNTFVLAAKHDTRLRANWRRPLSPESLAEFGELSREASTHHVDLVAAISPGVDICYHSDEDYQTLVDRLEEFRSVGITRFQIALDDIPEVPNCDEDGQRKPGETAETAWVRSQAFLLNRLQKDYIKANGLPDLMMTPTDYVGTTATPAKKAQAQHLDPNIAVQWTGKEIVIEEITAAEAEAAARSYDTKNLIIWDNYPTNDGENTDRLFLAPVHGRAADLHKKAAGILMNPMIQPYASTPALIGLGAYSWNGAKYNEVESLDLALDRIAGADSGQVRDTLEAFVDLNISWRFNGNLPESPQMRADIEAVETAISEGRATRNSPEVVKLRERLRLLAYAPKTFGALADQHFAADVSPWTWASSQWAQAMIHALELRVHNGQKRSGAKVDAGTNPATWTTNMKRFRGLAQRRTLDVLDPDAHTPIMRPDSVQPTLGDGLFEDFCSKAEKGQ